MKMKYILLFLMFVLNANILTAQELSVKSFEVRPNDQTLKTNSRQDEKGNDCALVKVLLTAPGAVFNGDVIGDVKCDANEYWVYMPQGSKRLTVKLEGYLPLEISFEDYGVKALEAKTTYMMILTGIIVNGQLQPTPRIKEGWIMLTSSPEGASVFINGELVGKTPLGNYKNEYGIYSYQLKLPNYLNASGTIELYDNKIEKTITLEPVYDIIHVLEGESLSMKMANYQGDSRNIKITGWMKENDADAQRKYEIDQEATWYSVYWEEYESPDWTALRHFIIDRGVKRLDLTELHIKEIGYRALEDLSDFFGEIILISVSLPASAISIGNSAFRGCRRLVSVNIPNSVTSIGDYAFANCARLTSVNIPNSVTSIGKGAFRDCSNLKSVTIPRNLEIRDDIFEGCSKDLVIKKF